MICLFWLSQGINAFLGRWLIIQGAQIFSDAR
jgi:hypothetical protein